MNCGAPTPLGGVCSHCRVAYQKAWVVGPYHGALGEMIRRIKFDGARAGLYEVAGLIAECLPSLPDTVRIVPIPTIARHIRLRGFDHTDRIARELSRLTHASVVRHIARKHNSVQVGASKSVREKQARGAYDVKGVVDPGLIYLLLDDVVTTGASMREAAKVLRSGGAETIWAVCLAREALDDRDDI